jgi:cytochrome c peroxidase
MKFHATHQRITEHLFSNNKKHIKKILLLNIVLGSLTAGLVAAAEPFAPLPVPGLKNEALVELGKFLFFEPRLSKSGYISCNSCHNLSMGGSDNLKTSIGHNWQQGPINSPTVLNAAGNIAQFWDGRAQDLKEQAGGPIANPKEMAFSHQQSTAVIKSIPRYQAMFKAVFNSDDINIEQVTSAIAAFEETLVTPNSRFDLWLAGDNSQLTATELQGYQVFKNSGCAACHSGANIGGGSYQKLGVFAPYITQNTAHGRMDVTGKEADKNLFKVPTLRNIELTYPYFHDGEVASLEEAVTLMGKLQVNKNFTQQEVTQVVSFLKTLTGDQPNIQLPHLPPSTNATPVPRPFD